VLAVVVPELGGVVVPVVLVVDEVPVVSLLVAAGFESVEAVSPVVAGLEQPKTRAMARRGM